MNLSSMFEGAIGHITAGWIIFTAAFALLFILVLIAKCRRITRDCNSITTPVDEDLIGKKPIGKIILSQVNKSTTEYAGDALNLATVSAQYKFNLRLIQAIPSILTSIGILGTFFGLSYAVVHFDSSSSEGIRDSIETLLSGMGIAFYTSIAGMFCSLVFLFLEKIYVNNASNAIDQLSARLDADYHLSIGDELENLFQSQLSPLINDLSQKLENPAQVVVDSLLTEFKGISENFADLLTDKVNKRMEDLLEQFILATDSMKEIPGSIETATKNLIKSSEESIHSQEDFTKETEDRVKQLTTELTNSVKEQIGKVVEQFDATTTEIKGLPALLKDATGSISQEINNSVEAQRVVTKEFSDQLESLKGIDQIFSDAMQKIADANADLANTKSAISGLTNKINEAATSIKSASDGISENNTKMLNDLETLYDMNRDITQQFKDYSTRIDGIERGLQGIFNEIEKGLNNYATTSRDGMQTLLDSFTDSVTNAMQGISNATNRLQETIGGVMQTLSSTERVANTLLSRVEKLPQNTK